MIRSQALGLMTRLGAWGGWGLATGCAVYKCGSAKIEGRAAAGNPVDRITRLPTLKSPDGLSAHCIYGAMKAKTVVSFQT